MTASGSLRRQRSATANPSRSLIVVCGLLCWFPARVLANRRSGQCLVEVKGGNGVQEARKDGEAARRASGGGGGGL